MSKLRKASRKKAKIKMLLQGASGSGKTYSALQLAFGITNDWSKIAVIDTENQSADLYSDLGEYLVYPMDEGFSPDKYIEGIEASVKAGIEVVIIDSITHEWAWCLERVDQVKDKYKGNSYFAWGEVTPLHNRFINEILQCPVHVIATTRTKQEYVLNTKNGKTAPQKVGTKQVQREGVEYEFTLVLDLDMAHHATASKDRTSLFMDKSPEIITPKTGKKILAWCESGAAVEPRLLVNTPPPSPKPPQKKIENWIPYVYDLRDKEIIVKGMLAKKFKAEALDGKRFDNMFKSLEEFKIEWDQELFGEGGNLIVFNIKPEAKKPVHMLYALSPSQTKSMQDYAIANDDETGEATMNEHAFEQGKEVADTEVGPALESDLELINELKELGN